MAFSIAVLIAGGWTSHLFETARFRVVYAMSGLLVIRRSNHGRTFAVMAPLRLLPIATFLA
jgi:hypothetical protein